MDLTSKILIKNLLKSYGFQPSKRLGQNFLVDKKAMEKIIRAAELEPNDIILEIGPGLGTLTVELAKRVKKVIAVEKDQKMAKVLEKTLKSFHNIEVIQGDILRTQNLKFKTKNYKVVANLPYYVASPVIRKFLECNVARPRYMVLMVQKEVGQRICAKPPDMSLLAVSVQFYAEPKIISYVSNKSFWPKPKVNSAIIKIVPYKNQAIARNLSGLFFKIVKAGFSQPRKQIANNLAKELKLDKEKVKSWLLKNGINPVQRAETLNIQDWIKLTKNLKEKF